MHFSRPSIFLIVVSAPFALLTFFAVRTLGIEYDALSLRRTALLQERLEATGKLLSAQLDLLGADGLLKAREVLVTRGTEALRYFVLEGGVVFALVYNDEGRLFPLDGDLLMEQEQRGLRAFEEKALVLRRDMADRKSKSDDTLVPTNDGSHALLRCERGSDGIDLCTTVDAAAVTKVLRTALASVAPEVGADQVWLTAPDNRRIAILASTGQPSVSRPLTGLLRGWRIEAADIAAARADPMQAVGMFAIGGSLIIAWGALAFSFYRTSQIEAQGAARRAQVIAQLSHELRTPLANLRLYVDLMGRKAGDTEAMATYGAVIESEIGRLEQLAENAIDVGRGAMTTQRLETGVPDVVVGAIAARLEPMLTAAGCATRMTCSASATCLFDRPVLERIMVNLLDNARKYAPGSAIDIATSLRDRTLRLEIRDYGPGVPSTQAHRIFEPLIRGRHAGVAGFGLGLATVRHLAQQCGGDVWLEDAAPGARFCVEMRVALAVDAGDLHAC